MERKIGEIFQVKGRGVQVVKQPYISECIECCFNNHGACFIQDGAGECDSTNRADKEDVIFKVLPPLYYLDANRTYVFDFTGKKVKYATNDNKLSTQTKFDLAWFIDRINPDLHMELCEDVYKYDEVKQTLLRVLTEKMYTNVQIIK